MMLISDTVPLVQLIIVIIMLLMNVSIESVSLTKFITRLPSNASQRDNHRKFLIHNVQPIVLIGIKDHYLVLDALLICLFIIYKQKNANLVQLIQPMTELEIYVPCSVLLVKCSIQ